MRQYKLYVKDILEAMDAIEIFVRGMEFEGQMCILKLRRSSRG